ncbi:hypothetical protein H9635_07765 [Solibacillus sp. A46]|uniref:Uncharacterized protein n=1 Tax=Solibacillus faecavium TaxID=2762221 RepID=A0ABR8XXH3_9BACL|nr:hypothetical protein [Solibacillus faecavium]MBD8036635.1 hypothetical protein [Solibacillus faecavium]
MNPKQKKSNVLQLFVDRYKDIAEVEEEKLQLQTEVIAVYTELCLSTVLFKRNSELKSFNDSLFFKIVDSPLLDYLYKSRTQLLARGIREIYSLDLYTLKTVQERLIEFIDNNHINIDSPENSNNNDENSGDFVDYWANIINNKGK